MRRIESALWSVVVDTRWLGVGGLNKVAVDSTGAPITPAVSAVNRQGI